MYDIFIFLKLFILLDPTSAISTASSSVGMLLYCRIYYAMRCLVFELVKKKCFANKASILSEYSWLPSACTFGLHLEPDVFLVALKWRLCHNLSCYGFFMSTLPQPSRSVPLIWPLDLQSAQQTDSIFLTGLVARAILPRHLPQPFESE